MVDKIAYNKLGSGPPVILLHGFPMNRRIWLDFSTKLSHSFSVYTPDLPGFGESPLLSRAFTLAEVAGVMNEWVKSLQLAEPSCVIGHSMGGYVALEMAKKSPDLFSGLGLFHSTAIDDAPEKKDSRSKVIRFIEDNGVLAFTSNFIQPLFADENHPAIAAVKDITIEASAESVQGYTRAMRDRTDNQRVLADFKGPVMLIGGDSDKGIPAESIKKQSELNPKTSVHILADTGHMGMFERQEETVEIVERFLEKIYQPGKPQRTR